MTITAGIAAAIRMCSAYNPNDDMRAVHGPRDVMLLSDSLHNFDQLGRAILEGSPALIMRACTGLEQAYARYTTEHTFERNAKFVNLPEAIALFGAIREKAQRSLAVVDASLPLTITLESHSDLSLAVAPVWQQTMTGRGWLFLDSSADNRIREEVEGLVRTMGRASHLHVVSLVDPSGSPAIDILGGSPSDIAWHLTSVLPEPGLSPGAMLTRQQSARAIQAIVAALRVVGRRVTALGICELLQYADSSLTLLSQVPSDAPEHHQLRSVLAVYGVTEGASAAAASAKLRGVFGGIAERLALLADGGPFGQVFASDSPEICMSDVLARQQMVYVQLGEVEHSPIARRLIAATLQSAALRQWQPTRGEQPPVQFALFDWNPDT